MSDSKFCNESEFSFLQPLKGWIFGATLGIATHGDYSNFLTPSATSCYLKVT